jgi:hypothetical protein
MSKFVRLTNNIGQHKGNILYINIDYITSVYEETTPDGVKTFVYGGPTGVVWDVEETTTEVIRKIEKVINEQSSSN